MDELDLENLGWALLLAHVALAAAQVASLAACWLAWRTEHARIALALATFGLGITLLWVRVMTNVFLVPSEPMRFGLLACMFSSLGAPGLGFARAAYRTLHAGRERA